MVEKGLADKIKFWRKLREEYKKEPILSKENAVVEVKEIVETALTTTLGIIRDGDKRYVNSRMQEWRGRLSVYPDAVDDGVTGDVLRGECDLLSEELAIALRKINFIVDLMQAPLHSYLAVSYKGHEIIIDPTIGQYVEGHNHVFVGTVNQLRGLLPSRYRERYESIWGSAVRDPIRPGEFVLIKKTI